MVSYSFGQNSIPGPRQLQWLVHAGFWTAGASRWSHQRI